MAHLLSQYLDEMSPKEFFQNVIFLESDSVAISKSLWEGASTLSVKNSKRLFDEDDEVSAEVHFLSKHSEENWYLRYSFCNPY